MNKGPIYPSWPVIIELDRTRRLVIQLVVAVAGLALLSIMLAVKLIDARRAHIRDLERFTREATAIERAVRKLLPHESRHGLPVNSWGYEPGKCYAQRGLGPLAQVSCEENDAWRANDL